MLMFRLHISFHSTHTASYSYSKFTKLIPFSEDQVILIVQEIAKWLGYNAITGEDISTAWVLLTHLLEKEYPEWKDFLRTKINQGCEVALSALKDIKEEIVKVCQANHVVLEQLSKLTVKTCAREGAKVVVKESSREGAKQVVKLVVKKGTTDGTKQAVKLGGKHAAKMVAKHSLKEATKQAVKQGAKQGAKLSGKQTAKLAAKKGAKEGTKQFLKQTTKQAASQGSRTLLKAASPLGIAADLAQAGCEAAGYKNVGKSIGMTGNIAAGAMMGSVGGPVGIAVGALGGFFLWGSGEVAGGLIDRAFGEEDEKEHERKQE